MNSFDNTVYTVRDVWTIGRETHFNVLEDSDRWSFDSRWATLVDTATIPCNCPIPQILLRGCKNPNHS